MKIRLNKEELGRIIRFGLVGTLCTAIHYGVYLLLLSYLNPTISYTCGYAVGFCCNYGLTTYFTFRQKSSLKNVAGFSFSHVVNCLLELGILWCLIHFGMGEKLAGIVTLMVVVPINFLLLRFVYLWKR
ncbi:MAG: GtrA family protein [Prevotella sp.]|nr:GtrA family protein [Candidatus Equicola faecalis]MDO4818951.1 GtrA family protein [Prevotella sp.]